MWFDPFKSDSLVSQQDPSRVWVAAKYRNNGLAQRTKTFLIRPDRFIDVGLPILFNGRFNHGVTKREEKCSMVTESAVAVSWQVVDNVLSAAELIDEKVTVLMAAPMIPGPKTET